MAAPERKVSFVGPYALEQRLGASGGTEVWTARKNDDNTVVALKIVPACMDEGAVLAQMQHTNIVPVYEVGACAGLHYYAMQLIEGRSLADAIAEWRAGDVNVPISRAGQYADSPNREADTLRSPEMPTAPVAALDTRKPRGDKARPVQGLIAGASPSRAAGLDAEAVLMQLAFEAGLPSPRVLHVLKPEEGLGKGFIMARVEGETIARKILRDAEFAAARNAPETRAHAVFAESISLAGPADAFAVFLRTEHERWSALIRDAGLRLNP